MSDLTGKENYAYLKRKSQEDRNKKKKVDSGE